MKFTVSTSHAIPLPPQSIFDAWTQPAAVRLWLAAALRQGGLAGDIATIDIDPRPGGGYLFSDLRDGAEARHYGTYLHYDPPRRLQFSWITGPEHTDDPSIVTIAFTPNDTGTTVTLTHDIDIAWSEYADRIEASWTRMLIAIGHHLTT